MRPSSPAGRGRGLRFGAALAMYACLSSGAAAQDVLAEDEVEWATLAAAEARLRLAPESPWEGRGALYYQRDGGLRRYAGAFGMLEGIYNHPRRGYLAAQAFYLDLAAGREATLLRLDGQRLWAGHRLAPLVRVTGERLAVASADDAERLLENYRLRVRIGALPQPAKRLRLVAMTEAFPTQSVTGPFREHRHYLGLSAGLAPAVTLNVVGVARWRGFESPRHQYTLFVGLVYAGALARVGER